MEPKTSDFLIGCAKMPYRSSFRRLLSNVGEPARLFVRLSRFGLYDGLTRPLLALSFGLRVVADRCGDLMDVLGLSGLLDLRLDSLLEASSTAESKTLYRKSYLCWKKKWLDD